MLDNISYLEAIPALSNPAGAAQILSGYDAVNDDGEVVEGAMPTVTQATPSISVSSAGKITASATQTAGYVSAGTKSATKQLTTKAATTWTPTTSNQTIASGTYLTGAQTIKGDANLVSENIVDGVSVFGVNGSAKVRGNIVGAEFTNSMISIGSRTEYIYDVNGNVLNSATTNRLVITFPVELDKIVSAYFYAYYKGSTNSTLFSLNRHSDLNIYGVQFSSHYTLADGSYQFFAFLNGKAIDTTQTINGTTMRLTATSLGDNCIYCSAQNASHFTNNFSFTFNDSVVGTGEYYYYE